MQPLISLSLLYIDNLPKMTSVVSVYFRHVTVIFLSQTQTRIYKSLISKQLLDIAPTLYSTLNVCISAL